MYNDYSDANLIDHESKKVTYSVIPAEVGGIDYWRVVRHCYHSYSYVGMAEAAARSGAEAISRSLIRRYAKWTASAGNGEIVINQDYSLEATSFAVAKNSGGSMWQIDVTIDDTDEIVSDHDLANADEVEQYFQAAESRDTFGRKIAITAATFESSKGHIQVEFTQNINNFDPSQLLAYYVSSQGVETQAQTRNASDSSIQLLTNSNKTFYLRYNVAPVVDSKKFTTREMFQPTVTIQSTKMIQPDGSGMPMLQIELTSDMQPSPLWMNVYLNGQKCHIPYVSSRGDSLYVFNADLPSNRSLLPALSQTCQIRIEFKSQVPLYINYNFTPQNYVTIQDAVWRNDEVVLTFTTSLTETQVRNRIKTVKFFGNNYGMSSGGVVSWISKVDDVYTLRAPVGPWEEKAGYYIAWIANTLDNGDDILNYYRGVTRYSAFIAIDDAKYITYAGGHEVIATTFSYGGIANFDISQVTAQYKTVGSDTWTNVNIFSRTSPDQIEIESPESPGAQIRYQYPNGAETLTSNAIVPLEGDNE